MTTFKDEDNIEATGGIAEELLEQRRLELFIGRTEAKSIIANCIDESRRQLNFCPSCGSKLPGRKPT